MHNSERSHSNLKANIMFLPRKTRVVNGRHKNDDFCSVKMCVSIHWKSNSSSLIELSTRHRDDIATKMAIK